MERLLRCQMLWRDWDKLSHFWYGNNQYCCCNKIWYYSINYYIIDINVCNISKSKDIQDNSLHNTNIKTAFTSMGLSINKVPLQAKSVTAFTSGGLLIYSFTGVCLYRLVLTSITTILLLFNNIRSLLFNQFLPNILIMIKVNDKRN